MTEVLEYAKNNAVRDEGSIVLKIDNEITRIMRNDIAYIEVKGHYVDIHTVSETIIYKTSFEDLMELLNENSLVFIKTHRSYAVNLDKILKIGRMEVTLITKETVPVSKSMYESVNKAFIKYNLER
ncbi:MAG: LytTR family transcriptional regulator [Lachnospiraceae bacterium]|nr:LytTR family transcriptional regulator [Lachnospiraceae bacterium]